MSPILLKRMIDREKIAGMVYEKLDENMFLVDVSVSTTNVIHIEVDSFSGLTIDQCIGISRHIEGQLDRETDDFELQVSSPGADQPFKVKQQYKRNLGREVEVVTSEGTVIKGVLSACDEEGIIMEVTSKVKAAGRAKKEMVTSNVSVSYGEIKKTKVIISFK
jgi:ribosome maturation factor RimP